MERDNSFCIVIIFLLFAATSANSQYVQYGTSLDTPTDSRSIALGESFVALPRNHAGMIYNPATIANVTGVALSYGRRNNNILGIEGRNIWALSAAFQVPYVDIGIFYNRFNLGEFEVTTEQFPDGTGQKVNPYDITFGITIARKFDEHWNVGISVKSENMSGLYNLTLSSFTNTVSKPILFDLGILYTHQFPINESNQSHALNFGTSFQNIGADPEVTTTYLTPPSPNARSVNNAIELARYFRIGLSYELNLNPGSDEMLRPFRFVGTGEFRTITNSNFNTAKDFWASVWKQRCLT
jgi:hypothetical protein